jgi:hypothetical protein
MAQACVDSGCGRDDAEQAKRAENNQILALVGSQAVFRVNRMLQG